LYKGLLKNLSYDMKRIKILIIGDINQV